MVTSVSRDDESAAAHGARWITLAFVTVGVFNYGYSLLLTHLLSVSSYSKFAAGQGLILWASAIATVSVPWVLAQALVRARTVEERHAATRFARLASSSGGVIAAAVVGSIASNFTASLTALTLALSTLVIFMGTTTTGWLQGQQRMRQLSALYVGENLLKNGAGVVLVVVFGLRETGALAAFGIGGVVMLLWWPRTPRSTGRAWRQVLANRSLWQRALHVAGIQGIVSLLTAVDVVGVAVLPGSRAMAASYQASAALSRVPLFVAGAVTTAFFPLLSRRADGRALVARAVRMYAAVALPLTVVLMTTPASVLEAVFPPQYAATASVLKYTAVTGLAVGGVSLVAAFFQAVDDYACLWWLGGGLCGYVVGLLAGWRAGGVRGLAIGAALGATGALVLLGSRLVRRQGWSVLARVPLIEPALLGGILILLHPHPALWMGAAALAGVRAGAHFFRPGARHARMGCAVPSRRGVSDRAAAALVADAVWRGRVRRATDVELRHALLVARRNRVEGRLALAYPQQLAGELARARTACSLYIRNLREASNWLQSAGVRPVLIKESAPGDDRASCVNLIVPELAWHDALAALNRSRFSTTMHGFEGATKAILCPASGPQLHIQTSVSWAGVAMISADRLFSRARRTRGGIWVPAADDQLRISLGRALYQDLAWDLSGLLVLRKIMHTRVIMPAREQATREGWRDGFDTALESAAIIMQKLDHGHPVILPSSLAAPSSAEVAGKAMRIQRPLKGQGALVTDSLQRSLTVPNGTKVMSR